ncbi:MAG: hypothetical protein P4L31_03245 [Candidatus Babeliales bacterium]|nr:hypothetical protein [Candidatus Babeliales bacterium]
MTNKINVNSNLHVNNQRMNHKPTGHRQTQSNHSSQVINPHDSSSQKTTTSRVCEGWNRATFILRVEHLEKLKAISYWDRTTIKDIMNDVISSYLENKSKQILKK